MLQCTRIFKANCCLEVYNAHNAHLKLASSISGSVHNLYITPWSWVFRRRLAWVLCLLEPLPEPHMLPLDFPLTWSKNVKFCMPRKLRHFYYWYHAYLLCSDWVPVLRPVVWSCWCQRTSEKYPPDYHRLTFSLLNPKMEYKTYTWDKHVFPQYGILALTGR